MNIKLRQVLTILTIVFSFSFASSFESVNDLFSLSLPDTIDACKPMLYYNIDHQELLRESLNDTLLSRYTIRSQNLRFLYIGKDLLYDASWSRKVLNINDILNSDYSYTDITPESHTLKFNIQTSVKKYLLTSGIQYAFSRTSDTLFISDYPLSDQGAMNSYFFDLLPQTFGDTLPYRYASDMFKTHFRISDRQFMFYLEYSQYAIRLNESHTNTSNNALNGPRKSICKLRYSGLKALGSWKINEHSLIWVGANYMALPLNWKHTVFPDNPDTLERVNIADGNTQSLNAQLGYQSLTFPVNIKATIASGFTTNTSEASTPVLGYVLGFLPISHQANMTIANTYLLAYLHGDYPIEKGGFILTPRFDLVAGRVWTDISIQALLQFGLEDIDIQEKYVHAVYITSFACSAQLPINKDLSIWLDVEQLIPFVKTVSPVTPAPPPDDIKRYGGLSIKAGVSMTW